MTREEFIQLFIKEIRARGYSISKCYPATIVFHHKSKFRNDKFVLRYQGEREVYKEEWIMSEDYNEEYFFDFQVQDYETYNLDWEYDRYSTQLSFYIGKTDMKVFVDEVIKAVGRYYG